MNSPVISCVAGVYGIRLGCMQRTAYGETIDFWSGLRAIHTRHIEIKYNQVSYVVRDTSDAGALEYWGVGVGNTAHHNCFSDLDPGILKGGWLYVLDSRITTSTRVVYVAPLYLN
jgi:hypothetical protein